MGYTVNIKYLTWILSFQIFIMAPESTLQAQAIEGVYRLSGVHEMVAAFEFKKDSSFEFYFAYGAVDRGASGHFKVYEGQITFLSDKTPGKDFKIIRASKSGNGTTVKITDANNALVRNIMGVFKKGPSIDEKYSDEKGIIHTDFKDCDSIFIIHTLFPDVPTQLIKGNSTHNNYFELTLNPSLAAVSFQGFSLTITADGLTGSLPYLFERDNVLFVKERE